MFSDLSFRNYSVVLVLSFQTRLSHWFRESSRGGKQKDDLLELISSLTTTWYCILNVLCCYLSLKCHELFQDSSSLVLEISDYTVTFPGDFSSPFSLCWIILDGCAVLSDLLCLVFFCLLSLLAVSFLMLEYISQTFLFHAALLFYRRLWKMKRLTLYLE